MSDVESTLVAAEVTRLISISDLRFTIYDFKSEPPHVGCCESDGGVEK
jgi:hypothetical protein